ncbi:early nodulin-like protein 18 [Gastrolobium bilobum]|uniref:early nodulin-like protein 18 n=1 Tax=Gastrolobium bilobum TaxID=150636 RepID=UPI002AB30F4B|nr:early nodulin-like protein 18 [Gastrolobium bilobum]
MAPFMEAYLTVFALLIATAAATGTGYRNHTVGDGAGWLFNSTTNTSATNYSSWAATQTFSLGDYLIFNTNSNETVIQTYNKTSYLSCSADDSDNGTFVYDDGSSQFGEALTIPVPLTIVGPNYFFSDNDDGVQCQHGLAFEIDVQHGLGLPPSLNQPPPPPYIEPPGPDTAQTPPLILAQPPNSGAYVSCADVRVAVYGFAVALLLLK